MTKIVGEPKCPVCQHKLDAVTAVSEEGAIPQPGDLTVCVYCTSALMFNHVMGFDVIDPNDLPEREKHDIMYAINYIRSFSGSVQ